MAESSQVPGHRPPVSAYMITYNNERTVESALRSLAWADEIVVVDSFSTDRTVEIARRYAGTFIQRAWPGFRDQYQFASGQCRHAWRVFADADEVVPPELAAEIQSELALNAARPESARVSGYYAQRRTCYLGRWIQHGGWVPDREIRVYDGARGAWKGGLHANVHIDGKVAEFRHVYQHYTYADIGDHLDTIDRYSTVAAREMFEAGRRFRLARLLFSPPGRFLRDYILKRGFLDGFAGLVVAVSTAFYVFIKQAKLWELQHGLGPARPPAAAGADGADGGSRPG